MPARYVPRIEEERTCICGIKFIVTGTPMALKKKAAFCSRVCANHNRTKDITERFASKIGETTDRGCILWAGSCGDNGYGHLGRTGERRGTMLAHRVAWELVNGPIPDGLQVLHECDNPPCVNVAHLFLGTHIDNHKDKANKGRGPRGEKNPKAKLTEEIVRSVRRRYASGLETQREIAEDLGIHLSSVERIVSSATWAHVED